jgi:hypothetical protein
MVSRATRRRVTSNRDRAKIPAVMIRSEQRHQRGHGHLELHPQRHVDDDHDQEHQQGDERLAETVPPLGADGPVETPLTDAGRLASVARIRHPAGGSLGLTIT